MVNLTRQEVNRIMDRMDVDQDHTVSFREFSDTLMEEMKKELSQQKKKRTFEYSLANFNGVLTMFLDGWQLVAISFEPSVPWSRGTRQAADAGMFINFKWPSVDDRTVFDAFFWTSWAAAMSFAPIAWSFFFQMQQDESG